MYESYISDEEIIFVRHYGTFRGAESLAAILSTFESNPPKSQIKGAFFDLRDVTSADLSDTDRAYGSFFTDKLSSYGQSMNLDNIVSIYDPENVELFATMSERNKRLSGRFMDIDNMQRVYSLPEALKILGLPADYCIKYPD
ncbi:MAG: hypothetical protein ACI8XU_002403 [Kiritimatiellia bacterium]|jgi:hypothetical protein